MIEIKDLSKTFSSASGTVEALRDINLTINDGEIFGIIGLSGAGKSTLVRCINLLERPTSGHVIIDGKDMTVLPRRELLERLSRCHESDEEVEYLRSTVENEGGLSFAAEVMQGYIARAVEMLSDYPDSEYRSALVNLCAYIAERDR